MALLILAIIILAIIVINSNNAASRACNESIRRSSHTRELSARIDRKKEELKEINKTKNYDQYMTLRKEIERLEHEYNVSVMNYGY